MGRVNVSSVRHERTFRRKMVRTSPGTISDISAELSWHFSNTTVYEFVADRSLQVTLLSANCCCLQIIWDMSVVCTYRNNGILYAVVFQKRRWVTFLFTARPCELFCRKVTDLHKFSCTNIWTSYRMILTYFKEFGI